MHALDKAARSRLAEIGALLDDPVRSDEADAAWRDRMERRRRFLRAWAAMGPHLSDSQRERMVQRFLDQNPDFPQELHPVAAAWLRRNAMGRRT